MKLLFDFLPIFIFFIAYKFAGIYIATGAFLVASAIQMLGFWLKYRRFEKMHIITFVVGTVLGGATLFLHDMMFIKWKPTAIYWILALAFVLTPKFTKKPLLQSMMEEAIALPPKLWTRLNISWAIFFVLMGALNLFVVYHFDTNTWVNFKVFGLLTLTILFILGQSIILNKHIKTDD